MQRNQAFHVYLLVVMTLVFLSSRMIPISKDANDVRNQDTV